MDFLHTLTHCELMTGSPLPLQQRGNPGTLHPSLKKKKYWGKKTTNPNPLLYPSDDDGRRWALAERLWHLLILCTAQLEDK